MSPVVTSNTSAILLCLISVEYVYKTSLAKLDLPCKTQSASLADTYTWLLIHVEYHYQRNKIIFSERNVHEVTYFIILKLPRKA